MDVNATNGCVLIGVKTEIQPGLRDSSSSSSSKYRGKSISSIRLAFALLTLTSFSLGGLNHVHASVRVYARVCVDITGTVILNSWSVGYGSGTLLPRSSFLEFWFGFFSSVVYLLARGEKLTFVPSLILKFWCGAGRRCGLRYFYALLVSGTTAQGVYSSSARCDTVTTPRP